MLDKGKEELRKRIMEELDNYTNVNWNLKEYYEKAHFQKELRVVK